MEFDESPSRKGILLTSSQQPQVHPLATIIHDANNKLHPILLGFDEREGELKENESTIMMAVVESVRNKLQALLNVVRGGNIESDKFASDLVDLYGQIRSVLPLAQDERKTKYIVPRALLERSIDEFDMLIERGLQFIENEPPEDLPVLEDISVYVSDIVHDYQHQYPHVSFNLVIDTDCEVFFHPPSIKRALENLLNNAIQALPKESGEISITLQNKSYNTEGKPFIEIEEGTYVSIEIKDNGSGISEDVFEKLKHSSITTKEDGSGFGLVSVRKSMIRHKGHLILESESGCGSTVTALIPSTYPPPKPSTEFPNDK